MPRKASLSDDRVLATMRASARPMSAYELIDALSEDGVGGPKPPTVYRALERLIDAGSAHRVESLNAFIACRHAHEHEVLLAICEQCGQVDEVDDHELCRVLQRYAELEQFRPKKRVFEITGTCRRCVH